MSAYRQTLRQRRYTFDSLKSLLAKASPARSGDELAGIAAESSEERVAAQLCLAELPLRTFLDEALVPYEVDEVIRLILDSHEPAAFATVSSLTVGDFRNWLLAYDTDAAALAALAPGVTPEMAAGTSAAEDWRFLGAAAKSIFPVPPCEEAIAGLPPALSRALVFQIRSAGVCNSRATLLNDPPWLESGTDGDAPGLSCCDGVSCRRLFATGVPTAR
jgi:ethanolamine ammonia-lyase large subunit